MEKELNVIEVPASGNTDWGGGAYCLVFLYTKHSGNLIIKGYRNEVKEYIEKNYTHYFANYTLWCRGHHRSIWTFWKDDYYIITPARKKSKGKRSTCYKWVLTNYGKHEVRLEFRRFPKQWIKEFNNL